MGSPDGPTRAAARDAWISISATRPWTSGSLRSELGQDAAEPQRVLAERRPHPVVAGGRRVALVEDEVDDLEHRRQAGGELGPARDLEGDARLGEGALGPDDALGDRSARGTRKARAISSVVRPPSRRSVSATRASVRQDRMAGGEHEAQADRRRRRRRARRRDPARPSPAGPRARDRAPRACARAACLRRKLVDRAMLRGGHEPGARIVRDARLRPLLERGDERVLRELLGEADVAHDPREPGDEPRPTRSARPRRSRDGCR